MIVSALLACALSSQGRPKGEVPDLLTKLAALDDRTLEKKFAAWLGDEDDDEGKGMQVCLSEMLRRGGERWKRVVSAALARIEADPKDRGELENLELLTALRRMEGKRDPVVLEVEARRKIRTTFPGLPR